MAFFHRSHSARPQLLPNRFDRAQGVVGTRQGDTTVLLDVNRGMYYTLNEVGGRIWELLGTGVTVPVIIEQLGEEYDVSRETLSTDTATLIDRLVQAKLVKAAGQ